MKKPNAPRIASKIEHWPLARLKKFKTNPRLHSEEQVREIAGSIREFGFTNPILIDARRRTILAGEGRYEASKLLELAKVPVIDIGYLSPAQQAAYVIADNRLAEKATWNRLHLGTLALELQAASYPVAMTGFTEAEMAGFVAELKASGVPEETAPAPPRPETPVTRPGDIWEMGAHRVRCGDAASIDEVIALLSGEKADVVWTDPPKLHPDTPLRTADRSRRRPLSKVPSAKKPILNDDLDEESLGTLLTAALTAAFSSMKEGAPIYLAHPDGAGAMLFRRVFADVGFYLSCCLIWRKNTLVLSRGDYHHQHEPILYGWKPGGRHRWYGGRKQTTIHEFDEPPFHQVDDDQWQIRIGDDTLLVRGKELTVELASGSVHSEPRPRSSREHPTMKPPGLIERHLGNSARGGDVVLDLFGGSGSTLIAAERLGMKARLLELDPGYVDVTVRRWQNLTGGEAKLAGSGQTLEALKRRRRKAG
jgi:DNA modification methylase